MNFAEPKSGRTALHYGIEKEFDPAQLAWLGDHGASPDIKDKRGASARDRAFAQARQAVAGRAYMTACVVASTDHGVVL